LTRHGRRRRGYIFMRQFDEYKKWVRHDWVDIGGNTLAGTVGVDGWFGHKGTDECRTSDDGSRRRAGTGPFKGECRAPSQEYHSWKAKGDEWGWAACQDLDGNIEDFPVGASDSASDVLLVVGRGIVGGITTEAKTVKIETEGGKFAGAKAAALCGQNNPETHNQEHKKEWNAWADSEEYDLEPYGRTFEGLLEKP